MNPAQRRLLQLAQAAEEGHLKAARAAVAGQFRAMTLTQAEKALKAALAQPKARRTQAVRGVLALVGEATSAARVPPPALLGILRRAVHDRVLNATDLATLTDPARLFGDTRELQASAVARQRQDMNRYWSGETRRFRDDVAATVRQAIRQGLDPTEAGTILQARLGVHESRAMLIAQDQLLTAIARAEQSVLRAAGVKSFQWYALMDGHTRKAHAELHGRVFTWRAAPELPGGAINCRCRAILPLEA